MNFLKNIRNFFTKDHPNMQKYSKEELKKKLSPLQYQVTQENGTEPPFKSNRVIH
jgi:hypothetical protein